MKHYSLDKRNNPTLCNSKIYSLCHRESDNRIYNELAGGYRNGEKLQSWRPLFFFVYHQTIVIDDMSVPKKRNRFYFTTAGGGLYHPELPSCIYFQVSSLKGKRRREWEESQCSMIFSPGVLFIVGKSTMKFKTDLPG
jgi:hypothetical protein